MLLSATQSATKRERPDRRLLLIPENIPAELRGLPPIDAGCPADVANSGRAPANLEDLCEH